MTIRIGTGEMNHLRLKSCRQAAKSRSLLSESLGFRQATKAARNESTLKKALLLELRKPLVRIRSAGATGAVIRTSFRDVSHGAKMPLFISYLYATISVENYKEKTFQMSSAFVTIFAAVSGKRRSD